MIGSLVLVVLTFIVFRAALRKAREADRGETTNPKAAGIEKRLWKEMRKVAERVEKFYD